MLPKGKHLVNSSKPVAKLLLLLPLPAFAAQLYPGAQATPAGAEVMKDDKAEATADEAEAKLEFDFDLEDLWAMAEESVEAARERATEAAEKAQKDAEKGTQDWRRQASQQMEAARKQLEEARKQWQKQIEDARKQMQLAARAMRTAERQERLMSVYPRIGILIKASPSGAGAAGTVVQGVTPGSPADKAGIKAGDVITAIDGQQVQDSSDGGTDENTVARAVKLLRKIRPGHQIEIEYRRGKEIRKAEVQLESRRTSWSYAFRDNGHGGTVELPGGWVGLELAAINPDLGAYFGTSRGLLVLHSSANGDVAPLKPGDVILKIGNEEPSTPTQAVRLLRSYEPGQSIPVEVLRQKQKQTLALQMPRSASDKQ